MLPKTLLMVVDGHQTDQNLDTAISLARETGLHLSILVIGILPRSPINSRRGVATESWESECEAVLWLLHQRSQALSGLVRNANISAEVLSECCEIDEVDDLVGEHARYADMTLIEPELLKNHGLDAHCLSGALFESGRPVLLVPQATPFTLKPRNILVAWDAGVEAARAVREALALLAQTGTVNVVTVKTTDDAGEAVTDTDLSAYLMRHGIHVKLREICSNGQAVADVLKQHALDVGAELLVMGSYGHSRMRERVFGATTQSMLSKPIVPVLMAR